MQLFDHEAERRLIGAALIDPSVTARIGYLPPVAMHHPHHALIWRVILDLAAGGPDWDDLVLKARLRDSGATEGVLESLRLAEEEVLSASSAAMHAETVRDRWQRRRLLEAAEEIRRSALSPERKGSELAADAEGALLRAVSDAGASSKPRPIRDGLTEYLQRLQTAKERGGIVGLETGIGGIDRMTKGLRGGQVIVIAARPGAGKSALADQIADHVASRGLGSTLEFNLEMSISEMAGRPLVRKLQLDEDGILEEIKTTAGQSRVKSAAEEIYQHRRHIETRASLTIAEIRAIARRHALEHPDLALVVIDYLQLVGAGLRRSESREREVAHVSRQVKYLAQELNKPVLLLSQLNRDAEKNNREPRLSDLRESGSVEQDADIVLFIHHDGQAMQGAAGDGVPGELIVAKNRGNPTGRVAIWFRKQWLTFQPREIQREEEPKEELQGKVIRRPWGRK